MKTQAAQSRQAAKPLVRGTPAGREWVSEWVCVFVCGRFVGVGMSVWVSERLLSVVLVLWAVEMDSWLVCKLDMSSAGLYLEK